MERRCDTKEEDIMRPGDSEDGKLSEFERKIREMASAGQGSRPVDSPLCRPHHDDVVLSEREREIFAALELAWLRADAQCEMTSPAPEPAGRPLLACLLVMAASLLGVFLVLASFLAESP
jgi:hypothetical protein